MTGHSGSPWPSAGAWIIAGTSAAVDWQLAAAAIAATAGDRVAVLAIGAGRPPSSLLLEHVATWQTVQAGASAEVSAAEVGRLVLTLRETYGLVLVAADAGLLVPLGRAGWTLADLALSLSAPAVVVTGEGPDAINHTTLALAALSGQGLTAAVVTVGEPAEVEALPVAPAGAIPADAATRPSEFAAAAPAWLDQILHAGVRPEPTAEAQPAPATRTVAGRRVVFMLLAVFAVAVLLACGIAFVNRPVSHQSAQLSSSATAIPQRVPRPLSAVPIPSPCPERSGGVIPARADAATQARVDAAWLGIEKWLRTHAPGTARSLHGPATTASIDRLQRQMSVAFPVDLVASLRRHNGAAPDGFTLAPFYHPFSVAGIAAEWTLDCRTMADVRVPGGWWDKAYVPYAGANDSGCLLADQRPGAHGHVGEFYPENGTTFDGWPASIAGLLEQTAQALETGKSWNGDWRPAVVGGILRWETG